MPTTTTEPSIPPPLTFNRQPRIACFGEILWDMLPAGLFVGGAPFNVAYHLKQQGVDARLISAIGKDQLGDELFRRLAGWDMPADCLSRHDNLPTGTVRATIGSKGDASYEILENVAWDHIPLNPQCLRFIAQADGLVFGSLAQRSQANRDALHQLLDQLPEKALRIFDVNLRPPHDDLALVQSLTKRASLLKVNSDEAARLANSHKSADSHQQEHARTIAKDSGCQLICVTSGAHGAGLLANDEWIWETGRNIQVADTVGAGDSFLATLVAGLFASGPTAETLARACRIGEYVASQRGATPSLP